MKKKNENAGNLKRKISSVKHLFLMDSLKKSAINSNTFLCTKISIVRRFVTADFLKNKIQYFFGGIRLGIVYPYYNTSKFSDIMI